jgi:hypothetical protein
MNEAEEVLDVLFPSGNESAEVVHPCEEPFHFPSPAISPELASILSFLSATSPVGAIISMLYSAASFWSSGSESYALSPMSLAGS